MNPGDHVIRRARALVGTPFRPQGRDPRIGLDCIGLALCVFGIPADAVRRDYRMRGLHRQPIEAGLKQWFQPVREIESGDLLLCEVSQEQMHLAIRCADSFIHADARLRRVVETPGSPCWPIARAFRRPVIQDRKN
jgi:cell wall-associated NlpC family hydrolase